MTHSLQFGLSMSKPTQSDKLDGYLVLVLLVLNLNISSAFLNTCFCRSANYNPLKSNRLVTVLGTIQTGYSNWRKEITLVNKFVKHAVLGCMPCWLQNTKGTFSVTCSFKLQNNKIVYNKMCSRAVIGKRNNLTADHECHTRQEIEQPMPGGTTGPPCPQRL